jgi:5-methylcytosine-specific restriction endonuclease McrA
MPKQSRLEHVADDVLALYQQGKSLSEVAAVFKVSLTTVYRLLEKKGISRRPLSEANSIKWTPQRKEQHAAKLRGKPSGASGKRWTMDRVVVRPNARGKRNPKWRGGKTALALLIRTSGRYRVWREAVFARDSYTCVHCGVHSGNGHRIWLNADHVVPLSHLMTQHKLLTFEDAEQCAALWDVSNGRTLCVECHRATPTFGRNLVRD